MKYKVGDVVLLYTWKEINNVFSGVTNGNMYAWYTRWRDYLPLRGVITITGISVSEDYYYTFSSKHNIHIPKEIVKCYAGEFYLQQIKDEL